MIITVRKTSRLPNDDLAGAARRIAKAMAGGYEVQIYGLADREMNRLWALTETELNKMAENE